MARPAEKPRNARGREIMRLLTEQGECLTSAARKIGTDYSTLHDFVHFDSPRVSVGLVCRVVERLHIPIQVACPELAEVLKLPSRRSQTVA